MRQIKIRYLHNEEWHYITLDGSENLRVAFEKWENIGKTTKFEQYTGLSSKSGKEIYEGDIYKDDDGIGQIFFCYGAFTMGKKKAWSDPMAWDMYSDKEHYKIGQHHPEKHQIEVIGNIHENPELLSKE